MQRILVTAGLLCFFLAGANAFAQSSRISGIVNDAQGALIPGVSVTATNTATGVTTTVVSNETGAYAFASLPAGTYKLNAELPGFQGQAYDNVTLGQADQLRFNFRLTVASVSQAVEVTVDAQALLTATNASVGEAIEQKRVVELPMVRGDILDLVRIMPGMRVDPFGDTFNAMGGIPNNTINTTRDGLSVTDSRTGVLSATTTMNPDSVGEVRVILAPVDAEYGRGNGQVQVLTRSGTNAFRGAAVWNNRNTKLQANSWTNNEQIDALTHKWNATPLNWRNTNQYTLSFGGPIIKNKTFFFGLWDQNMSVTRQIVTVPVLTDTARNGVFRYFDNWANADAHQLPPTFPANAATATIAVVDTAGNPVVGGGFTPPMNPNGTPYTGSLRCFSVFGNIKMDGSAFSGADCPGGVAMTGSAWDPLRATPDPTGYVAKLLAAMPHANYFYDGSTLISGVTPDGLNVAAFRWTQRLNGTSGAAGQGGTAPDTINRKQSNVKIDHNFNANNRLSGSWTLQHDFNEENPPNWPGGYLGQSLRHPQVLTVGFTSTLSSAMVNEARYGINFQYNEVDPAWLLNSNAAGYLLQGGKSAAGATYPVAFTPGAGNFSFGNNLINNASTYSGSRSPLYDYADTFSYTKGKHAIRTGFDLRFGRSAGWNVTGSPVPSASGGAGGNPATNLVNAVAGLPNDLAANRTNASNMLYLLAGSVNAASTPYWIGGLQDAQNGTWEDYTTQPRRTREQVYNEWAAFFKDDWKVKPSLTLNLGVRYEWYGSPFLRGGYTASVVGQGNGLFGVNRTNATANPFNNWLLAPGNVYLSGYGPSAAPASALQCSNTAAAQNSLLPAPSCDPTLLSSFEYVGPGSNHPDLQAVRNYWGGFGPAIGLAWQLPWFGAGKTTIRAGFGRTYGIGARAASTIEGVIGNVPNAATTAALVTTNFPNLVTNRALQLSDLPIIQPVTPAVKPGQPLAITDGTQSLSAYDPNFKTPYTQTLTFSVTRQVSRTLTLDLRYDGTFARRRADSSMNINTPNVYYQPELFNALEVTRAGGDAPLFDQMFAGLVLPGVTAPYGAVGTTVNGVVQHGSAQLRRATTLEGYLALGDYADLANSLSSLTAGVTGLESLPAGLTNINGRVKRNGCDRIAAGLTTVGPSIPTPLRCFSENYFLANPEVATASYIGGFGKANYNSAQAQVTMRPTQGLSFQSTYIFARVLGIVPGGWNDPLNRNADYAPPYQDVRHDLRTNGTFELPIGPGKLLMPKTSGTLGRILEHWQTGFIFNVSSGNPRTVVGAKTLYATGLQNLDVAQSRANLVAPQLFSQNTKGSVAWNPAGNNGFFYGSGKFLTVADQQCAPGGVTDHVDEMGFNLVNSGFCTLQSIAQNSGGTPGQTIFQNAFPGHRGNMPFGLNAPGQYRFDANISKRFKLTETKSFAFRLDCLNVFNHPGPGDPQPTTGQNINTPGIIFGQLTSKGVLGSGANPQMRYITGQLRLDF
jgi:Carboxypeptidase regulatory-like domain